MHEAVPAHGTPRQLVGDDAPHLTEAGEGGLGDVPGGSGGGLVRGGGDGSNGTSGGGGGGGGGNGEIGRPCLQNTGLSEQRSDQQPLSTDQKENIPPPQNRAASGFVSSSSLASRHLSQNRPTCTTEPSCSSGAAHTTAQVWRRQVLCANGLGATDRPSAVARVQEASAHKKSRMAWVHSCSMSPATLLSEAGRRSSMQLIAL